MSFPLEEGVLARGQAAATVRDPELSSVDKYRADSTGPAIAEGGELPFPNVRFFLPRQPCPLRWRPLDEERTVWRGSW